MASVRFYTAIYVALMTLATAKVVFSELFGYWLAAAGILVAALVKTGLIVGYFQHLRSEPRSLTYLIATGAFMVLLLASAASFSIL